MGPCKRQVFSYKVVSDYRQFLADEKQLEELCKRFERYTRPVVNVGGVQ